MTADLSTYQNETGKGMQESTMQTPKGFYGSGRKTPDTFDAVPLQWGGRVAVRGVGRTGELDGLLHKQATQHLYSKLGLLWSDQDAPLVGAALRS